MSEDENGFPGVQLSTFVKNDQLVFRAPSGEALKDLLVGVAENGEGILEALNSVKQVVIAKGVITSSATQAGEGKATPAKSTPRKATGGRAKDAPPPNTDGVDFFEGEDGRTYASIECEHGPMVKVEGAKRDLYCTLNTKNWKDKCDAIKL